MSIRSSDPGIDAPRGPHAAKNQSIFRVVIAIVGLFLFTTALAPTAMAGCGNSLELKPTVVPIGMLKPAQAKSAFRLVSFAPAVERGDADTDSSEIVGLWSFKFVSQGNNYEPFNIPDGTLLDTGYATWHSDGTELMNSGRDPKTGSFCMGVWAKVGRRTFKLNHFALSWTGKTPNVPDGADNIQEEVTVDRTGNSYTGTFTIDHYDNDGNKTPVHLTGNITATRITVN